MMDRAASLACPDCAAARAMAWHGGYRTGCQGCTARALARSMVAFQAHRTADAGALREACLRLLPKMDLPEAVELVWEWWAMDHDRIEQSTAA